MLTLTLSDLGVKVDLKTRVTLITTGGNNGFFSLQLFYAYWTSVAHPYTFIAQPSS